MRVLTPSVLCLTAAVGVVGTNSLLLSPIAASVAESFVGATASDVLMAAALYGLAVAVSALTLAPQVDRLGADRVMLYALGLMIVSLAATAAAPALGWLIAAQGLAGIAAGVALPATYSLTAEVAQKGREAETLGVVLTGWTIALVAGVALAAPLTAISHWRVVFVALSVLTLIVAFVLRARLARRSISAGGHAVSPLTALRTPGIGPALLVCAAFMTAFYGTYTYIGTYVQEGLGRSAADAGLIALAYGIGFGLTVPLDRLVDRWGARKAAPLVFGGIMTSYLALAIFSEIFWAIILTCLVWGMVNHVGMTLIVGGLSALDPARRGAILGLYSATTYLSVTIAVVIYRPLFEGPGFAYAAAASALCIAPAIWQAVRRRRATMP